MAGALMSERLSRRRFLAGVSVCTAGLAGCSSRDAVESLSGPSFDTIVDDVSVESKEVVLELASSDVTEAVLIGPDGTAFDSQLLDSGVRTVRFPILELDLQLSRSSHYTPGEYEVIVVVADGTEYSQPLSIEPDLQVTAVEQYRDGESLDDLAALAITIQNNGTGPTWVYDITFEEALNYSANGTISEFPAISYLKEPTTSEELILSLGEDQRYLSNSWPLALPENQDCSGTEHNFSAHIGVADGNPLNLDLAAHFDGESHSIGFVSEVVCTEISVNWTVNNEAI